MDGITMNATATAARFTSRLHAFGRYVESAGADAVEAQARSLHAVIVQTSPVDTGRLRESWAPPHERGSPLIWGTETAVEYAGILEYGGYRGVGPKTVALAGGDLGAGFVAEGGIYSQQAPLGFVRRALAAMLEPFKLRLSGMLQQGWDSAEAGSMMTHSVVGRQQSQVLLGSHQEIAALFGITFDAMPAVPSIRLTGRNYGQFPR